MNAAMPGDTATTTTSDHSTLQAGGEGGPDGSVAWPSDDSQQGTRAPTP